ncbi:MAG: disulfide bond formation protein B [Simkaniaceae bacterium]
MIKVARFLNSLWILILSAVLIGAYIYEITTDQHPCPLCLLQRIAMISVGFGACLNLRYGIKAIHYALSLISSSFGASVSLRQISLHVCPQFPSFGFPVFGLELFTWAFIVFGCSAIGLSFLLYIYREEHEIPRMNFLEKAVIYILFILSLGNVITTFMDCGFSFC